MSEPGLRATATGTASLHVAVSQIQFSADAARLSPPLSAYQRAEPDPLHAGAAEQLQHLAEHHPEAITMLSRLCERAALLSAVRVLPIALDRYGVVLRIERLRDHTDVPLAFRHRVDSGAEAAHELRHLLLQGQRRRHCGR